MRLPTEQERPYFRMVAFLALHALLVAFFLFGAFRLLIGWERVENRMGAIEQRIVALHGEETTRVAPPYTAHDHAQWCQQLQKMNPGLTVPIPPEE